MLYPYKTPQNKYICVCVYILLNILLLFYRTCFYKALVNTRKLLFEWHSTNKAETYLKQSSKCKLTTIM